MTIFFLYHFYRILHFYSWADDLLELQDGTRFPNSERSRTLVAPILIPQIIFSQQPLSFILFILVAGTLSAGFACFCSLHRGKL